MGTEATGMSGKKPPSLPLPPALFLIRARSRAARVVDLDDDGAAASRPATPPLRSPVTVPFLWEEAPGKPKQQSDAVAGTPPDAPAAMARSTVLVGGGATATVATAATAASGDHDGGAEARPVPLKLPPRLQVTSTAANSSLSPKTVLQGPYGCAGGGKRPPRVLRRTGSFAAFCRRPSAGGVFFSRMKATTDPWINRKGGHEHDAAASDASCSSPAPSSASSSSSSVSYFGDDHGHGAQRRPADGRADCEGDEGGKGSVRITRFRRNKSLPSMTTSHLWASIRKSVKQIAPWS